MNVHDNNNTANADRINARIDTILLDFLAAETVSLPAFADIVNYTGNIG